MLIREQAGGRKLSKQPSPKSEAPDILRIDLTATTATADDRTCEEAL